MIVIARVVKFHDLSRTRKELTKTVFDTVVTRERVAMSAAIDNIAKTMFATMRKLIAAAAVPRVVAAAH